MNTIKKGLGALFSGSAKSRISYRRLFAFVVSTGLLIGSKLGEENWMIVVLAFMGLEGAVALVSAVKPPPAQSSGNPGQLPDTTPAP